MLPEPVIIDINKVSPLEIQPIGHYILGESRKVPNGSRIVLPDGSDAEETYIHVLAVGSEVKGLKAGDMVHAKLTPPEKVDGHGVMHGGKKKYLFAESCVTARLVEPVES